MAEEVLERKSLAAAVSVGRLFRSVVPPAIFGTLSKSFFPFVPTPSGTVDFGSVDTAVVVGGAVHMMPSHSSVEHSLACFGLSPGHSITPDSGLAGRGLSHS